ncbi:ROK family protein [uncultured Amnibacterium sp.]|uniref:ROK family protein n=1 Tax=uncultured Amnibacterium sp. TaxID=1631851 RepID=UPI0035CC8B80
MEDGVGGGRDAGRPAKLFGFLGRSGLVAGVDVGGHLIRVAVSDLAGTVVASEEMPLDPARGGSTAFDTICGLLDALLESLEDSGPLLSIAVGVTGLVGPDGRVAMSYALPAWNAADVAGRLTTKYSCGVVLENDARLASIAEHYLGASVLADDVVYIQVGHRISVSLLIEGKVHRGRHHASGEAGYLLFDGVATDAASNIRWRSAETAEEVVARSLRGDAKATDELTAFLNALAPGIAALALVTDPDLVVLGGGLSMAGEVVLGVLREAVRSHIRIPAVPTLVRSDLGADAVVIGAVLRAHELSAMSVYGAEGIVPAPAGLKSMRRADRARAAFEPAAPQKAGDSTISSPSSHH